MCRSYGETKPKFVRACYRLGDALKGRKVHHANAVRAGWKPGGHLPRALVREQGVYWWHE